MASMNLDHQYVEEAKRKKSKDEMRQNIGTVHHLQLLLGQYGHVTRNSGIHSVILPPIESSFARTLFQHGVIILCSLLHQGAPLYLQVQNKRAENYPTASNASVLRKTHHNVRTFSSSTCYWKYYTNLIPAISNWSGSLLMNRHANTTNDYNRCFSTHRCSVPMDAHSL